MQRSAFILTAMAPLVLAVAVPAAPAGSAPLPRETTEQRCGRCHATGVSDTSSDPIAPPLRDMFKRYPVSGLDDAFRDGLEVGHRDMPRFTLTVDERAAIISYIESLNPCARPSSDKAAMAKCFGPM